MIGFLAFQSSQLDVHAQTATSTSSTTQQVAMQSTTTSKRLATISKETMIRTDIVKYALQFKGSPYVWGGTSLTKGVDCSGFTQSVFKDQGIYIPRTSRTQATSGKTISVKNIKPGDLVFYATNGRVDHVALYIGNGKVIHASTPKTGVRITKLYYRKPYKVVDYIKM
jgi:cell wall-associated NlpC family hydrolase